MLFLRAGHFVSWKSFTETWSLLFRLDSLSGGSPGSTCCHLSWQRSTYHDPFVSDMSSALELRSSGLFVCVHPSASFEAVSFCIPGWSQTHHVSASAPWVWIHYRYTKPYQTLLSIFFFPCWDRAAPSLGLVWLKCKYPMLLWVICRFYLIPQKLSFLRAIALPPRLFWSPAICPCRILPFYYMQSESEKSRIEFESQTKWCFLTLTSNATLTWSFKYCSTTLIISHFLMPFIKTVE